MLHANHMPDAARRAAPTDNETCVRLLLNRRGAGNGEAPRGAALRLILAGGLYFSDFSSLSSRQKTDPPLRSRLSSRQLEVLRLIEMGQTKPEYYKIRAELYTERGEDLLAGYDFQAAKGTK